jgi:predicted DNA-binding transcriptional regulator YafY
VELRSPDPYCPIDLSYEGGEIVVSQAESMDRPLRLAVDEASALLVALRMLAEIGKVGAVPGLDEGQALNRTIAKLEAAAGEAGAVSEQVAVQMDGRAPAEIQATVAEGLRRERRLHLSYYVPGRDEATERDVDPMRVVLVQGRAYLEGWCRRAEAVRLFRLDRVLDVQILEDVPREVPDEAEEVDVDSGLFRASEGDISVELELGPAAHWVADYYPYEERTDLSDDRIRVLLRTPDTQWVRRLALRLGEDGRVVAPADLADQVIKDATAALAQYS